MHLVKILAPLFGVALFACAKAAPLPGDSVQADGAVTLTPPRLSTSPAAAVQTGADPIRDRLIPPELVMEHQGDLALTIAQRDAINAEVDKLQRDVLRMQWDMQAEKEKLVKALDADHVDEPAVNASAARVMKLENDIKSAHLAMLVHVKNALTSDQIRTLRTLHDEARCAPAAATAPTASTSAPPPPSAEPAPVSPRKAPSPKPGQNDTYNHF
ncbi:MAG TPA: periplasmic heavy metal sensor [Labilithrix sp.]|jgi:Spy/CpxP family protein refolding chaperone